MHPEPATPYTNGHAPAPAPTAPEPPQLGAATLAHGIRVEVVTVTPELAKRWLEKVHPNRKISWPRVEAMSHDILNGKFVLTHQGICFDADGLLVDGQHRLSAIVAAKVSAELIVFHHPAAKIDDPVDRGRPRSIAMTLNLHDRDAAALNVLRMFEAGYRLHTPATVASISQALERHGPVLDAIIQVPYRGRLLAGVIAAGVWARPCGPEKTDEFLSCVASGEMIARGHPAFSFRAWQERNKRAYAFDVGLAALNCLRHFLNDLPLTSVYTSEGGLRAFCSRRRALRVPHTPGTDTVLSMGWVPKGRDADEPSEGQ